MSDPEARPPRQPLVGAGEIECHVRDMSATMGAEMTLADAQQQLGEHDQWLPIDGDPDRPIGRLVECNSSGPLRLGYGAWRDLLLGCQFRNGRGELITAGGRTVKNVAGYDLSKFMVGQRGIFGSLVTITTRTYHRPEAALLARFQADVRLVNRLMPSDCRPQWALLSEAGLLCGYLGDEATIDYYQAHLTEHAPQEITRRPPEADMEQRRALWVGEGVWTFRAAVPPIRVLEFMEQAKCGRWIADAAFGIVLGEAGEHEAIRRAAEAVGGRASRLYADGTLAEVSTNPAERRMIEKLKEAFDPDGRLAPLPPMTA